VISGVDSAEQARDWWNESSGGTSGVYPEIINIAQSVIVGVVQNLLLSLLQNSSSLELTNRLNKL
jgi:hypothetical protein